ncbi:MAG: four helix bundle protein [Phycisphaerae bacterium]|nr:four helix bundle protein [Phycisphaerae bacterium]
MQDFRKLSVWRKAHELTLAVYRTTIDFPDEERFGLTRQLRRACVSIAANLAEGTGRGGDKDFARFCQMAMGSATEVEYHLLLAHDLGMLNSQDHQDLTTTVIEIEKMLTSLMKKLRKN